MRIFHGIVFTRTRTYSEIFQICISVPLRRKPVRFLWNKIKTSDSLILESKNFDFKTKLYRGSV